MGFDPFSGNDWKKSTNYVTIPNPWTDGYMNKKAKFYFVFEQQNNEALLKMVNDVVSHPNIWLDVMHVTDYDNPRKEILPAR